MLGMAEHAIFRVAEDGGIVYVGFLSPPRLMALRIS